MKALLGLVACLVLGLLPSPTNAAVRFRVSYPPEAYAGPFSGRIVVYLSRTRAEPRLGPDWLNPEPALSASCKGLRPDQTILIAPAMAVCFPRSFSAIPAGRYVVQAVIDRNLGGRTPGSSPGNLYSDARAVEIGASSDRTVDLECDNVIPEPVFKETEHIKCVVMRSKLLSRFYGRPTMMRAAVALPEEWSAEPKRLFPVDFDIPGFGGSYMDVSGQEFVFPSNNGVPFVAVMLDPNCPTGHCVFADSANNGPWGEALTTEFIPFIEKKFRCVGQPGARFVGGHSSGGWSSLWLQVQYPDFFGGVFSTSPDPVDFRAFQLTNIYAPNENLFVDRKGSKVPLARLAGGNFLYSQDWVQMEAPIRGEQMGSFNAVFSPRGKDGQPESLWDPTSGKIRPEVAEAWKKYDIALKLKREWPTLGPKLKGKVHVWVGTEDSFYLDGAVHLLADELKELGSDAEIAFVPGDHFTMLTPEIRDRMYKEEADLYRAWKARSDRESAKSRAARG